MAVKTVEILGIGPVQLQKHRRSRSLKISLQANGTVQVSLPPWAPYSAAIAFAKSKRDWISAHRESPVLLEAGQAIGKAHHLYFVPSTSATKITTRQKDNQLIISFPVSALATSAEVQQAGRRLAIRALRREAESLLPQRLASLAQQYGFEYGSVQVRQLKARWGSCSNKRDITLNLFLMQLPWDLIDYVLIHELCHTKHLHHGEDFWAEFLHVMPDAKQRRKRMREHKPAI